jgi:hypothetical protein
MAAISSTPLDTNPINALLAGPSRRACGMPALLMMAVTKPITKATRKILSVAKTTQPTAARIKRRGDSDRGDSDRASVSTSRSESAVRLSCRIVTAVLLNAGPCPWDFSCAHRGKITGGEDRRSMIRKYGTLRTNGPIRPKGPTGSCRITAPEPRRMAATWRARAACGARPG